LSYSIKTEAGETVLHALVGKFDLPRSIDIRKLVKRCV